MTKLDNTLGRDFPALLDKRLPPGWRVVKSRTADSAQGPNILLDVIGPGGERTKIAVELKMRVEPKDVTPLIEQLKTYGQKLGENVITMVAAPFLSLSTRQRLKEAGIPYADPTGNLWIFSSKPGLYIETQGAERNPFPDERPAKSLKGAKASRIVRALCDSQPPFAVRKLAQSVNMDPGYVSRLLAFLESEDLIQRESRGPVKAVRWRKLIERWAQYYSFLDSNRVVSYLEPRDISGLAAKLASATKNLAITGSAAAAVFAPVAPTRMITAYVDSPEKTAERLGLRPAESGANVLLAEPYDPVVFERTQKRDGISYAAPSQIVADLMTGPGRNPSEAQALLNWMQENESTWRA